MTRKSIIAREKKRTLIANKYRSRIDALNRELRDPQTSPERKLQCSFQLQALPKDAHANRRRNRCQITGRPRGVFRKFGICRHMIRLLASKGLIPGLMKGSW